MPEGAVQTNVDGKNLMIRLPEQLFAGDTSEVWDAAYVVWWDAIPLCETQVKGEKKVRAQADSCLGNLDGGVTITSVMQEILACPIKSMSPLGSLLFLADIKRQLAELI